ncbi:hypothetical protein TRP8649_02679 [Pelagimonas phthalicica]|uniref:Uncharacterized protein n=1 Tax=Pelagimonas phthalicica TaxID=1037362 RepID=A0A238JEC2_9RHOB|nr:hypothetical protein CLV87_2680 [Pelagimonas phthalicica]SMX28554.1 hypothetical protein TRP8649_02679 [Pelagimonas phthalicica]
MFWEDFLIELLAIALTLPPFVVLLPKFGLSRWWALVVATGLGMIVLLWVMAYKALPRKEES